MFDINFIEEITSLLLQGDSTKAAKLLEKEAMKSRDRKRVVVAKRLENLAKKMPGGNKFGASSLTPNEELYEIPSSNLLTEYMPTISSEETVLNIDAKNAVASLFNEWSDFDRLTSFGLQPANKILLYGAPGTGKTRLANAIAHKLDLPLVLVRLDELVSSYLGRTGKNIREIFEVANERRVVLFLDEIDTVAKHRGDEKELGELKRIVTVLLQNIDFFPQHSILIGATNHEDILDKAIWRRFPLKIKLDLPSPESRELLLELFLKEVQKDIDLRFIVEITDGLSGSEIYDLSQQALKHYVISGNEKLLTKDILVAHFQLMLGKRLDSKVDKKTAYQMAQRLKDFGYSLREIESMTNIAYTTLRDHVS